MPYILSVFLFLFASILSFSQSNTYRVGFLLDKNSPDINGLLTALSNEISAVVGEDAIIEFPETAKLVNNFDASKALSTTMRYYTEIQISLLPLVS